MSKLTLRLAAAAVCLAALAALAFPGIARGRQTGDRSTVAATQEWYLCMATGGVVRGIWLPDVGICVPPKL